MDTLKEELKKALIEALNLEDLTPNDIEDDKPLFADDGLGLDSIDALELGLALQKRYGITLSADAEETRRHFASIKALAQLVASHR